MRAYSIAILLTIVGANWLGSSLATNDNEATSSSVAAPSVLLAEDNDPVARWCQLHAVLFDEHDHGVKSDEVKLMLEEMMKMELTNEFKVALNSNKSTNENSERITNYKLMEIEFRDKGIISKVELGLTETLLETYEHLTNNCSKIYFNGLEYLVNNIGGKVIGTILVENRELKFKSCWFRFVRALESVSLLMGSDEIGLLKELMKMIESSSPNGPVHTTAKERMTNYLGKRVNPKQRERYTKAIAKFLQTKQKKVANLNSDEAQNIWFRFDSQFSQHIWDPCSNLITLSSKIMDDLNTFLTRFMIHKRAYMTDQHFEIIDLTKMCANILVNANLKDESKLKHQIMFGEDMLKSLEENNKKLRETVERNDSAIQRLLAKAPTIPSIVPPPELTLSLGTLARDEEPLPNISGTHNVPGSSTFNLITQHDINDPSGWPSVADFDFMHNDGLQLQAQQHQQPHQHPPPSSAGFNDPEYHGSQMDLHQLLSFMEQPSEADEVTSLRRRKTPSPPARSSQLDPIGPIEPINRIDPMMLGSSLHSNPASPRPFNFIPSPSPQDSQP